MNIELSTEELRKRKLFVATPMYGGQCTGIYTQSMQNLAIACAQWGVEMRVYYLFNESLITRARNYCVDEFLRSGSTHLMFIDSDIGFDADSVLTLLALQGDETPYDVLAGPYPKKTISWEKIKQAVDKGAADEDPRNLENYVGDFVFNLTPGIQEFRIDQPVEVMETGTGFMMIRRKSFEIFKNAYPEYAYLPDHVRTAEFDGSREIHAYFDCIIEEETKRYLSEDYMFCHLLRKAGGKIWLCPWLPLKHMGSYIFGGSLSHLATVGANLTADKGQLNKKPAAPVKNRAKFQPMSK